MIQYCMVSVDLVACIQLFYYAQYAFGTRVTSCGVPILNCVEATSAPKNG